MDTTMSEPAGPLRALQEDVERWAKRYWAGEYWPPHANLARLFEEAGEVARAVNQGYGPKRVKEGEACASLAAELGDLLFVALCLANSTGVDLQAAFDATLDKYRTRDEQPPSLGSA
jgi:NTP pyrophosphatase (non-canonical NTP hydrolase)